MIYRPKIVPASLLDLPEMIQILQHQVSVEIDFEPSQTSQEIGLRKIIANPEFGCVMVAKVKNNLVGMIGIHKRISTAYGGYCGTIEDFVVAPNYRHKGIGSLLLKSAKQYAVLNGFKTLQLFADPNDENSLNYYIRTSWIKTNMCLLHYDGH